MTDVFETIQAYLFHHHNWPEVVGPMINMRTGASWDPTPDFDNIISGESKALEVD